MKCSIQGNKKGGDMGRELARVDSSVNEEESQKCGAVVGMGIPKAIPTGKRWLYNRCRVRLW
jgi:hypothetical protein